MSNQMTNRDQSNAIQSALRTLEIERSGIDTLADAFKGELGSAFEKAIATIRAVPGRVIVTGVGKSGHIGSKLAATFASTGTPSHFVHSAEANHGDLGMIARDDVIIAMSWSGETRELGGVVSYSRRFEIPLIAITSREQSALGREADIVLLLPNAAEACPHGLAPTTSTLMQLAIGDALAVALLENRGFTAVDFRNFHPGGQLGASLARVSDIMHEGDRVPLIAVGANMREAVLCISQKGFGCVGVVDTDGSLAGIITDGDLRRHIDSDLLSMTVNDVMTANPKTIGPDLMVAKALTLVNTSGITTLMITDADNKPIGIVHLHDLLRVGAA